MDSLDVSTGKWTCLPPLSVWRLHASLGVADGRLFVIGGRVHFNGGPGDLYPSTASVEEYLALEGRWVSVPDLPIAVAEATVVALNGKLLVIGGRKSAAVLEYNLADHRWKTLPSLLTARSRAAVTVLEGNVVVMGGYGASSQPLLSVERYNQWTRHWEVMPSLTNRLCNPAAVVIQV